MEFTYVWINLDRRVHSYTMDSDHTNISQQAKILTKSTKFLTRKIQKKKSQFLELLRECNKKKIVPSSFSFGGFYYLPHT